MPFSLSPAEARQLAELQARAAGGMNIAAVAPSGQYLHGAGGTFSAFGVEPGIINAMALPDNSLRSYLPWIKSTNDYAIFQILTAQAASSGSDATTACATGKTPGGLSVCAQALPFGEIRMATRPLQLNKIGRQINRAEMLDYRLVGDPLTAMPIPESVKSNTLRSEKEARLREMLFAMFRDYGAWDYTGTPASLNTAGMKQYYGLETQINTGHQDALTSPAALCPAADAWVDATLSGTAWSSNAANIVRRIHDVVRRQEDLARRTGLAPVEFGFVMQYAQFIELSYYWPCNVYTMGCTGPSGTTIQLSASDLTALRNDMQMNNYLLVGGKKYPVFTSEYLTESNPSAGVYASDIYFLPLRSPKFIDSNGWITYYEYLDYEQNLGSVQNILGDFPRSRFAITPGGQYLIYETVQDGLCIQWGAVTEHRLICKAPFLAARFTGIRYTDGVPQRSGIPGDANYAAGGVATYAAPTYQTPI